MKKLLGRGLAAALGVAVLATAVSAAVELEEWRSKDGAVVMLVPKGWEVLGDEPNVTWSTFLGDKLAAIQLTWYEMPMDAKQYIDMVKGQRQQELQDVKDVSVAGGAGFTGWQKDEEFVNTYVVICAKGKAVTVMYRAHQDLQKDLKETYDRITGSIRPQ